MAGHCSTVQYTVDTIVHKNYRIHKHTKTLFCRISYTDHKNHKKEKVQHFYQFLFTLKK